MIWTFLFIYFFRLIGIVLAMVDAFEDLGNPFMEDSGDLLDLDEPIVMPPDVVDCVREVKVIGMKRYTAFIDKRVRSQEEAFTAAIPRTRLKMFKAPLSQPRNKSEVAVVKDQQAKVTQLLLAVNSGRKIDEGVFSHESSPHPPSLTLKEKMPCMSLCGCHGSCSFSIKL